MKKCLESGNLLQIKFKIKQNNFNMKMKIATDKFKNCKKKFQNIKRKSMKEKVLNCCMKNNANYMIH